MNKETEVIRNALFGIIKSLDRITTSDPIVPIEHGRYIVVCKYQHTVSQVVGVSSQCYVLTAQGHYIETINHHFFDLLVDDVVSMIKIITKFNEPSDKDQLVKELTVYYQHWKRLTGAISSTITVPFDMLQSNEY